MTEKTKVLIEDIKDRLAFFRVVGLEDALIALNKEASFDKLPGYNAAKSVIEALLGDYRVTMYARNVRICAKAGVDMSEYAVGTCNGEYIFLEPFGAKEQ